MSKGTVRFPESAIVDGRIGTSRIAATIAGAAARLASDEPAPLDMATSRMVGMTCGVKTEIANLRQIAS
jgi:hypothetical protein